MLKWYNYNMKITIVGTGGVGGYLGAKLLKAHPDLTLTCIARGENLEAISQKGLAVVEDDDRFVVRPAYATKDLASVPPQDLILFCTKSYDLGKSARQLGGAITKDTILLPLLNGVDHDLTLAALYPHAHTLNGCVYILSELQKPGVVRKRGAFFYMVIGDRRGENDTVVRLANLFNEAGLKTKPSDRIVYETWKKYLFIGAFATITSYYDKSIGQIMEEKPQEARKLLDEIVAVANAKGIPLDEEEIQKALKQARNVPFDSQTSMQRDFGASKPTELESLSGYIVREGEKLNEEVPLMKRFYESLKRKNLPALER